MMTTQNEAARYRNACNAIRESLRDFYPHSDEARRERFHAHLAAFATAPSPAAAQRHREAAYSLELALGPALRG